MDASAKRKKKHIKRSKEQRLFADISFEVSDKNHKILTEGKGQKQYRSIQGKEPRKLPSSEQVQYAHRPCKNRTYCFKRKNKDDTFLKV